VSAPAPFPRPLCPLPARLAVLLSGRGSNFEALAEACDRGEIPGRIVLVVSDVPTAAGLEKARARGISSKVIGAAPRSTRIEREAELLEALAGAGADLICLAGFMRILSADFLSHLPAFPGLHAQDQAVRYGVRVSGATVHFVDAGTDTGPIVGQAAVPVLASDDASSLAARLLPAEHALYVASVRRVLEGGWWISGRSVMLPPPLEPF